MFSLPLSSVNTVKAFLQDSSPQLRQGTSLWHQMAEIKLGQRKGVGTFRVSSQVPITHDGALLSRGWLNTCLPWEAVNESLVLLCLCEGLFLCLLNCL